MAVPVWHQWASKGQRVTGAQSDDLRLFLALGRLPLHFHLGLQSCCLLLKPSLNVTVERHVEVVEVDHPAVQSAALGACLHQLVGGRLRNPHLSRVVADVSDVVVVDSYRRAVAD